MTGSTADRFRTGGAFDAIPDYEADIESRLRGRILNGYRVGGLIGSGGMGYVLHAARADGDFDRVAAIKIVASSHNTSELARRFRQEVQILARLNHPCIAQLYDAGETAEGWPYLVMEYVDGRPIHEYCADNRVSIRERVRLLMDVAEAVQFAHARLIVHRDLKPSNVLVDRNGRLKLLDFGIAKVLEDEPDDATRARVMTPRYASPEQLLGQPISIASDIYQLGLLMTEVLGGRLPTEDETLTDAIQRSAAGQLVTLPASVRQSLPDELVLIIEQCLRTDPADRYRGANYLRDDLEAWLTGYPVHAAGQRSGYRLRKFVRRNWGGVLTGVLTILALVSATVITTFQTIEAKKQRDLALYQQQRAEASSEFYGLVLSEMGEGSFTSVDLLDRGRVLLEAQYGLERPFMASVLFDVSKRYASLGEEDQQRELLAEAERIAREYGDDRILSGILCGQARSNQMGAPELAVEQLAEGFALHESLSNPPLGASIECYRAQSNAEVRAGNYSASLPPLEQALAIVDAHPSPSPGNRALLLSQIAFTHFYDGQPDRAITYLDETLETLESSGRGSTLLYQRIAANKAVTLSVLGRTPDALATFAGIREKMQASGLKSRGSAVQLVQYGNMLVEVARFDEAATIFEEGLEIAQASGNSRITASLALGMVKVHLANGEIAPAQEYLDLAETFVSNGEPKPLWHGIRAQRAKLLRLTGRLDAATREIDSLLTDMGYPETRRMMGLTTVLVESVELFRASGDFARANEIADGLVERQQERVNSDSPGSLHLGKALLQRAVVRFDSGQPGAAAKDLEAALPHLDYALGRDHPSTKQARDLLAAAEQAGAT